MKKNILKFLVPSLILLGLASSPVWAKVSVLYVNKDNTSYTLQISCNGAQDSLTVEPHAAGSKTLAGKAPCTVSLGKTKVTVQAREQVTIRKGKLYLQ